jgi:hypothetical protein
MPNFYFERYTESVVAAREQRPGRLVNNSTLIKGIEDLGGEERTAIAHAVPAEAKLVADALLSARRGTYPVERNPIIVSGIGGAALRNGWHLGKLVDGAPYMEGGRAYRDNTAHALLGEDGIVYAYMPWGSFKLNPETALKEDPGVILNRYAPVCATSMNDRAMLYGLASLVAKHDLDIQPAPINADA